MIIPSATAWPIPHDAPYKPTLDWYIMAITEAGLYEQWRKEQLLDVQRESRIRQRKELKKNQQIKDPIIGESGDSSIKALTLVHMQGPLLLLLLGLIAAGVIFVIEKVTARFSDKIKTQN
ncbi:uncharacterized protein LOC121874016 [Homarus americanus]|uniref:uncharacterized protein LOC121874016 n=1 Tax=Homarus americanus TaxID=6706 RepID=UPI001C44931C|nr:uncharacterized protein LOC121874016 [Homarus americanus]